MMMNLVEGDTFTVKISGPIANKIAVIKAIRMLTDLGLQEAKDISDMYNGQIQKLVFNARNCYGQAEVDQQFRILRTQGVEVGDPINRILEDLRNLASQALQQEEDELANEILQLVLAEKLRRK